MSSECHGSTYTLLSIITLFLLLLFLKAVLFGVCPQERESNSNVGRSITHNHLASQSVEMLQPAPWLLLILAVELRPHPLFLPYFCFPLQPRMHGNACVFVKQHLPYLHLPQKSCLTNVWGPRWGARRRHRHVPASPGMQLSLEPALLAPGHPGTSPPRCSLGCARSRAARSRALGCYCWIKLIKHLTHREEAFPSQRTTGLWGYPHLPPHLCVVWCYSNLFHLWLLAVFSALSVWLS